MYENCESNIFQNIKFVGEISNVDQIIYSGFPQSWKFLEFEKCPGKSSDLLIFMKNMEKSWNFT